MSPERSARAAFLDRDGTILVEKYYLSDPQMVEFIDGAVDALRALRDAGYKLVVVTNQSGIARGLYTIDEYLAVAARFGQLLESEGIRLDGVFFCPHHPDYTGPCECRKPGLGMYREAERKLGLDLASSVYVGDRMKDVLPGVELGAKAYLVSTGYGAEQAEHVPPGVEVVSDVLEAAHRIVGKTRTTP